MTLLIGLTGGIACGKSAVSSRLAQLGARVVDADQIARSVLAPHSEGLAEVVARWGSDVLDATGALNRARLGEIVFGDEEARRALEAITHPRIAQQSAQHIAQARAQKPPLVVYDAALLIEAQRADTFRPLVVVTTTPELQIARLQARDGLNKAEAQSRVDAQLSLAYKESLADHLIENVGNWEMLNQQIDALWVTLTGLHPDE